MRAAFAAMFMGWICVAGTSGAQTPTVEPSELGLRLPAPLPLPEDRLNMPEDYSLQDAVAEIAQEAVQAAANAPEPVYNAASPQIPDEILQGLRPRTRDDLRRERLGGTRPVIRPGHIEAVAAGPEAEAASSTEPETVTDEAVAPDIAPDIEEDLGDSGTAVAPLPNASAGQDVPEALALLQNTRPQLRPEQPVAGELSLPTLRPRAFSARPARGAICGRNDILGDVVGVVPGAGGCGIENAVRVRSVAGVSLSQPALIDCNTARALRHWVENGAKPALLRIGESPASIRIIGSYSCRTRNNQRGAPLSEHARGKAVDIGGINTGSGRYISLLDGWNRRNDGQALRVMHRAACDVFGTVLGPDANRFHRDHFHFDTASHRGGSYCR